jgi:hypothetical protein
MRKELARHVKPGPQGRRLVVRSGHRYHLEDSVTVLLPGERIDGTAVERAHLLRLLTTFRSDPPPMRLPEVSGLPLTALLASGTIDADTFRAGQSIMAARYEGLGVRDLLPLDRVWAGVRSAAATSSAHAWGGFHHPAQGYRHLQMDAAVTIYGELTGRVRGTRQSAALDLVRSYAHDCLHYATFRRYQLTDRGEIARVQYGINFRHPDGRTYSAPDTPGDGPTRNLGILMEGATDAEATAVARQTAEATGIVAMAPEPGTPGVVLADSLGLMTAADIRGALSSSHPYVRSLGRFNQAVSSRYRALLCELADNPAQLHEIFVTAMISGVLPPLEAWLDARHGAGCFVRWFCAQSFDQRSELVR